MAVQRSAGQKKIGLTTAQARALEHEGRVNVQIDKSARTTEQIVRENVFTYFNLIFLILTVLLIIAGSFRSLTFLPVIIANTLIGIVQELHAKKVLDSLSVLNAPSAQVFRDGVKVILPIDQLVLGDVIILHAGSQIPADAQVLRGSVNVNEALLTGEADEIEKRPGDPLMSGSFVVSGLCYATLTRVGADSYISRLMKKAKEQPGQEQSEMVRSINRIVMAAGVAIIPIGIILFLQGFVVSGESFATSITSMVAAVIGMIPEGLYLLVSITLATGSVLLARKQVMLHDMKSIETLARVNTLCVDKTGTITDNAMLVADAVPVEDLDAEGKRTLRELMCSYLGALSDDNITMQALRRYFPEKGTAKVLSSVPFSSRWKYSGVRFADQTCLLGAPEILLGDQYEDYRERIESYAGRGLRVMVLGRIRTGKGQDPSVPVPKEGLTGISVEPLMLLLLENPIRQGAPETFSYFVRQGVDVVVISGDNPLTVSRVAAKAGIAGAEKYVDARTLKSPQALQKAVLQYRVFGRVTPEQKRQIVLALQSAGRTVAMTGDGVNDILAMKTADCSIAMASGSDAAVQAAQVALLDSDFSHMPDIVAQGRRCINNIERSATLFLVKNIFSFLLSLYSILSLTTYPLQPAQISLISMFNIGIPAFFLAMEPNNRRIEGRFLPRVLGASLPAALTDFFAIVAMVIFGQTFGVSQSDVSVASTFLLAIVGFMILWKIAQPMNRYHLIVIIGCILGLFGTAWTLNSLFSIHNISTECIMLFVVFAIATEPCMRYLTLLGQTIAGQAGALAARRQERRIERARKILDEAQKAGETGR